MGGTKAKVQPNPPHRINISYLNDQLVIRLKSLHVNVSFVISLISKSISISLKGIQTLDCMPLTFLHLKATSRGNHEKKKFSHFLIHNSYCCALLHFSDTIYKVQNNSCTFNMSQSLTKSTPTVFHQTLKDDT